MFDNLPPGVTEDMIPGNRPEDQEIEIIMVFSKEEINRLRQYNDIQMELPVIKRHELWDVVSNMVEQFDDEST